MNESQAIQVLSRAAWVNQRMNYLFVEHRWSDIPTILLGTREKQLRMCFAMKHDWQIKTSGGSPWQSATAEEVKQELAKWQPSYKVGQKPEEQIMSLNLWDKDPVMLKKFADLLWTFKKAPTYVHRTIYNAQEPRGGVLPLFSGLKMPAEPYDPFNL